MPDRCATCAFRPGTRAASCDRTKLIIRLCLTSGTAFDCHEAPTGTLCEGFREAFEARKPEPEWRREVAQELLDFLEEAEAHGWPEERALQELHRRLIRSEASHA